MSKIFEALISANDLQAMSKKKLFDEMLRSFKKLGLTHNNELKAVILDIQTYEHLVDRLEELEEMQEDIQLAHNLSERLQLPKENWLEKPDHTPRMEFLRSMEKGSST
ncbi:MAG: hypothetical protein WBZ33_04795 [Thermoactinomyces sp.]